MLVSLKTTETLLGIETHFSDRPNYKARIVSKLLKPF